MREKKYYLCFDGLERGTMINCLNEMQTKLISDGIYTDSLDELIFSNPLDNSSMPYHN